MSMTGRATSPGSGLVGAGHTAWAAYQSWVALALWFLIGVVGLSWLLWRQPHSSPSATRATPQRVVTQVGAGPHPPDCDLSGGGVVDRAGPVGDRGVGARGSLNSLIGALAEGNAGPTPIHRIAGEDGWIAQTQQAGQEMAVILTHGAHAAPGALSKAVMVDVFIRLPAQLVNFGAVLDGRVRAGVHERCPRRPVRR